MARRRQVRRGRVQRHVKAHEGLQRFRQPPHGRRHRIVPDRQDGNAQFAGDQAQRLAAGVGVAPAREDPREHDDVRAGLQAAPQQRRVPRHPVRPQVLVHQEPVLPGQLAPLKRTEQVMLVVRQAARRIGVAPLLRDEQHARPVSPLRRAPTGEAGRTRRQAAAQPRVNHPHRQGFDEIDGASRCPAKAANPFRPEGLLDDRLGRVPQGVAPGLGKALKGLGQHARALRPGAEGLALPEGPALADPQAAAPLARIIPRGCDRINAAEGNGVLPAGQDRPADADPRAPGVLREQHPGMLSPAKAEVERSASPTWSRRSSRRSSPAEQPRPLGPCLPAPGSRPNAWPSIPRRLGGTGLKGNRWSSPLARSGFSRHAGHQCYADGKTTNSVLCVARRCSPVLRSASRRGYFAAFGRTGTYPAIRPPTTATQTDPQPTERAMNSVRASSISAT